MLQLRDQRKEDLDKHVAAINAELRNQKADIDGNESAAEVDGEDEEWNGIEDGAAEVEQDAEYVDEDKYTIVTVEAMDQPGEESEDDEVQEFKAAKAEKANRDAAQVVKKKRIWSKDGPKEKTKKKKFRYESEAERQATRQKQKLKSRAAKARRMGK